MYIIFICTGRPPTHWASAGGIDSQSLIPGGGMQVTFTSKSQVSSTSGKRVGMARSTGGSDGDKEGGGAGGWMIRKLYEYELRQDTSAAPCHGSGTALTLKVSS
jgi:hypothetical protein